MEEAASVDELQPVENDGDSCSTSQEEVQEGESCIASPLSTTPQETPETLEGVDSFDPAPEEPRERQDPKSVSTSRRAYNTAQSNDSYFSLRSGRPSILLHRTQSGSLASTYKESGRRNEDNKVVFEKIEIFEIPVLLGDNPGGTKGPPLTLDWEHQDHFELSVDDYEECRPVRRGKHELFHPTTARIEILRQSGYSRREIMRLTASVNRARALRRVTVESLHFSGMEELGEKITRGTVNFLTFGARKRKERKLFDTCAQLESHYLSRESAKEVDKAVRMTDDAEDCPTEEINLDEEALE